MKTQYKALLLDTILKEARSKTLILLFIITTIVILLGHAGVTLLNANMGEGHNAALFGESILTLILRILNTLILAISVIFGVSTIRSDFQNNIIYQYLTFPISRTEYFFIRVLGTWLLVLAYYIYAYVLSSVLYSYSFKIMIFGVHHFLSFLVMAIYILIGIFISVFFSMMFNRLGSFVAVFILSGLSSMAFNTFNNLPSNEYFVNLNVFKALGMIIYFFFPRMEFLSDLSFKILTQAKDISISHLLINVVHLIVASALYAALANIIVRKKNF